MNDSHTNSPDDAQRAIDRLAELFDTLATTDRAAAEDELRDMGLDPTAVGRSLHHRAQGGFADLDVPKRRPARHLRNVAPERAPTADRHSRDRSARPRHVATLAATLVIGIAIGALWMRLVDERTDLAEGTPASRQHAGDRLAAAPQVAQRADAPAASEDAVPPAACAPGHPRFDPATGRCAAAPAVPSAPPSTPDAADSSLEDAAGSSSALLAARAVVEAGRLDHKNWELAKRVLPEPILNRVKSGDYAYTIVDSDSRTLKKSYSDGFWRASAANAGKYDVDPATCGLKDVATGKVPDRYFGYPFPHIDRRDPQAACKMAWNAEAVNVMGEGGGETFSINGVDRSGVFKRLTAWRREVSFFGRHGGPIANPEQLRWTSMTGLREPLDVDGVGGLQKRRSDWTSQDQLWFYVPATRRVRRVNAATRSDPIAGLDIFDDDRNGYGGKIESFRWKLIGDGVVLAPLITTEVLPDVAQARFDVTVPAVRAVYEEGGKGAPWLITDNLSFTPRPVWIIEGWSNDPYYNFGKVIMYMDKDLYRIYWRLVHNQAGEYFYNAMCAYHTARDAEGTFSAVIQYLTVGVNDRTDRAALMRTESAFVDRSVPDDEFTLHHLTMMSD